MILADNTTDITNKKKMSKTYYCSACNYNTLDKRDYNKHLNTQKHNNMLNINNEEVINKEIKIYECNCGKNYKHLSSLCKHKKKCNIECLTNEKNTELVIKEKPNTIESNMVFDFVKQIAETNEMLIKTQITETSKQGLEFQKEMFSQMMEFMKSTVNITNNNNNNINNGNINNNHFNLQIFLTETCKNAMTIDEFIEYIQPTIQELEDTARLGYVEGITRIIMRGLKDLEEELRPFHCSDLKRETLFVKNSEGEWEKETEEKTLMMKFVKAVGRKNFNNVNKWRQENPTCKFYDSKSNDMFNQILVNSTSGRTEEEQKASYDKIIKNITKEIVIDKKSYKNNK